MSRAPRSILFALSLILLGSCAETIVRDPRAQALVETLAGEHENVLRLTVHAIPSGGSKYEIVASSDTSKIGKRSDPEDLKAMATGEAVVLEETVAIDVTVPIQLRDGKYTAATGVTMRATMGRRAAIDAAKAIAAEVDRGLPDAPAKK